MCTFPLNVGNCIHNVITRINTSLITTAKKAGRESQGCEDKDRIKEGEAGTGDGDDTYLLIIQVWLKPIPKICRWLCIPD